MMSACYVRSFQNKHLLKMFLFLTNKCQKMGNMRTSTEIVNPCIALLPIQLEIHHLVMFYMQKINSCYINSSFKTYQIAFYE